MADSRSFIDELSDVINSDITVLMWAGDADWICNWVGNKYVADKVEFAGHECFAERDMEPYTVNGKEKGMFKQEDNLSFLSVYEAGHEVPYYRTLFDFLPLCTGLIIPRAPDCSSGVRAEHEQEADLLDVIHHCQESESEHGTRLDLGYAFTFYLSHLYT